MVINSRLSTIFFYIIYFNSTMNIMIIFLDIRYIMVIGRKCIRIVSNIFWINLVKSIFMFKRLCFQRIKASFSYHGIYNFCDYPHWECCRRETCLMVEEECSSFLKFEWRHWKNSNKYSSPCCLELLSMAITSRVGSCNFPYSMKNRELLSILHLFYLTS